MIISAVGLSTVIENLAKVTEETILAADAAVQRAAVHCTGYAQELSPVLTGRLRDGYEAYNNGECSSSCENWVEYALFVEEGHYTVAGTFVPPQPALMPAFLDASEELVEELRNI